MKTVFRYNRLTALQSANVVVEDDLISIEFVPSIDERTQGAASEVPPPPGEPIKIEMSLADLKALRDFDGGAMLTFDANTASADAPIPWRNLYVDTVVGRRPTLDYLKQVGWNTPIRILVPARGISSIKQCRIILQMFDATKRLTCNEPIFEMTSPDFLAMQFVPEITGPASVAASDASALYTIQLRDADGVPVAASGSIYLEATAGNLNRHRVELDASGAGSFQLLTVGLSPGDKTKLKAGFRHFPGAFERVVSIT